MYKKTATYTDYNDVERTETFRFNLSRAEIAELELGTTGGYAKMLQSIVDAKDTPTLVKIFKDLILRAYGVVSDDGKRFIKSAELSEAFAQTEAYSDMFMEFATNADKAAEFINGIIPQNAKEAK